MSLLVRLRSDALTRVKCPAGLVSGHSSLAGKGGQDNDVVQHPPHRQPGVSSKNNLSAHSPTQDFFSTWLKCGLHLELLAVLDDHKGCFPNISTRDSGTEMPCLAEARSVCQSRGARDRPMGSLCPEHTAGKSISGLAEVPFDTHKCRMSYFIKTMSSGKTLSTRQPCSLPKWSGTRGCEERL